LRVAVEGGVVKYKKNGTVFYTSSVPPTYPLLVDTSLYSAGSTLSNVVIGGSSSPNINWLVTDQLGTPRMVFDKTGSLAATKRHDYLPFGEELTNGLRSSGLGYVADTVRQKFTQKERDNETGLDYFLARYYSSTQGRFTSPDEFKGGPEELFGEVDPHDPLFYADTAEPQSLNKYHYALNNPLRYIDPDGHQTTTADKLKQGVSSVAGFVTSAWKGEIKGLANIGIGASNIGAEAVNGSPTQPYQANNAGEAYGMRVVEVVSVFGGLLSGKGPARVMVAETKPTTAVAAEVGNAERTAAATTTETSSALGRSASTRTSGAQGQKTTTTVTDPAGSTTYKTTPGKTGGQNTTIIRKDSQGSVRYVKQEARHRTTDFNKPPDHKHYYRPKNKEFD
jgi:RHS repeat-associated protein